MTQTEQAQTVRVGHTGAVTPWFGTLVELTEGDVVLGPSGKAYEPCQRCGDFTGFISAHAGVFAGVCFGCGGRGYGKVHETLELAERAYTRRAKARAAAARRRDAKAAAERAAADAEFTAWVTANPDLAEALLPLAERWAPAKYDDHHGDYYYAEPDERVDGWLYAAALSVRNKLVPAHADAIQGLLVAYLAEQQAKAATEYVGQVGDTVTVTGKVTVTLPIDGMYGQSVLLVLTDGKVTAKTYTTAKWAWAAERGDTLTLTGTVKAQEEYEGTKQTVLARPKVVAPML